MTNEILRQKINDYAMDMEIEVKILDGEAYDGSIIGITEDGRMVYDFAKMAEDTWLTMVVQRKRLWNGWNTTRSER